MMMNRFLTRVIRGLVRCLDRSKSRMFLHPHLKRVRVYVLRMIT